MINDKLEKALELQEKGVPREEIWKQLEYKCIDPLTKLFKKNGYKYNQEIEKYVKQETDASSTTIMITPGAMTDIHPFTNDVQEKIFRLIDRYEDIDNIIEWFKNKDNSSSTEVVQVIQGLQINLPKSENIMITCRSNKAVYEQFNKFCYKHSEFKKGDLLAKALLDLMETYK